MEISTTDSRTKASEINRTVKLSKPVFRKADPDDFFKLLQKEVSDTILCDKSTVRKIYWKAVLFPALYILSYLGVLTLGNNIYCLFGCYIFMGISMILIFINVFHDAAHNAFFITRKYNHLAANVLEVFGVNSYIWSKRHLLLHHPYPNIQDWDIDIKQSDIVRIFPNQPYYKMHRFQHLYMPLLYLFYSLNWLLFRDFRDFYEKNGLLRRVTSIPLKEHIKLFFFKLLNFFYVLVLPIIILKTSALYILLAFVAMHFSGSAFGLTALISTHAGEDAIFPEVKNEDILDKTWSEHQITVTKDFGTNNFFGKHLFGGFSHHVAHHLFPTVSHAYYPQITELIKEYSARYNFTYKSYSTFEAIKSHFKLLKRNGTGLIFFDNMEL